MFGRVINYTGIRSADVFLTSLEDFLRRVMSIFDYIDSTHFTLPQTIVEEGEYEDEVEDEEAAFAQSVSLICFGQQPFDYEILRRLVICATGRIDLDYSFQFGERTFHDETMHGLLYQIVTAPAGVGFPLIKESIRTTIELSGGTLGSSAMEVFWDRYRHPDERVEFCTKSLIQNAEQVHAKAKEITWRAEDSMSLINKTFNEHDLLLGFLQRVSEQDVDRLFRSREDMAEYSYVPVTDLGHELPASNANQTLDANFGLSFQGNYLCRTGFEQRSRKLSEQEIQLLRELLCAPFFLERERAYEILNSGLRLETIDRVKRTKELNTLAQQKTRLRAKVSMIDVDFVKDKWQLTVNPRP